MAELNRAVMITVSFSRLIIKNITRRHPRTKNPIERIYGEKRTQNRNDGRQQQQQQQQQRQQTV
jgi:hypothetical protein